MLSFSVKISWHDPTPVSYTHLDVYKRQTLLTLKMASMVRPKRLSQSRTVDHGLTAQL